MQNTSAQNSAWRWIGLTAAVLALDTAATMQLDWPYPFWRLHWQLDSGFEVSTFVLWLAIPLALSWQTLDLGYFHPSRLKRIDWLFLMGLATVGVLSTLIVPHVQSLREIYLSQATLDLDRKWSFISHQVFWVAGWLVGWEFLHRYALLRAVDRAWPTGGWLWVPVSEFVFHLQKPWIEAGAMLAFSIVATQWSRRRHNLLLPFFAHLAIELGLTLQLAFF